MAEDEPTPESAYDELAERYDETVREGPYNANLEFPATASLVPDVEGSRVLDAGCGTGVYTAWLAEQGAEVVGVDVSEEMLARARERVKGDARLRQADLRDGLAFADADSFDGVVSALALGYVADWAGPLSAFARLLRPGGFLVFSTGHPLDQFPFEVDNGTANYFETERQHHEWAVDVPYYRRSFSAVINPVLEAGFRGRRATADGRVRATPAGTVREGVATACLSLCPRDTGLSARRSVGATRRCGRQVEVVERGGHPLFERLEPELLVVGERPVVSGLDQEHESDTALLACVLHRTGDESVGQ